MTMHTYQLTDNETNNIMTIMTTADREAFDKIVQKTRKITNHDTADLKHKLEEYNHNYIEIKPEKVFF